MGQIQLDSNEIKAQIDIKSKWTQELLIALINIGS